MWTCPYCNRQFKKDNQVHSCNDKTLDDFFTGKTDHVKKLFSHLVSVYKELAPISVYPLKSMIVIVLKEKRCIYIPQIGRNFIDFVFPFKQAYHDNLCFTKIKAVPGSDDHNHYFRMELEEDVNDEVKHFIRLSLGQ